MTLLPPESVENDDLSPGQVKACLNCATPAPGNFCPECGQETAQGSRSFAQYFHESMTRAAMGRSRLWQTLSKLLFSPGALTVEHKAGRRARYFRPLQLYLLTSVIVFAAVQFFGLSLGLRFVDEQGLHLLRNAPPVVDKAQVLRPAPIWSHRPTLSEGEQGGVSHGNLDGTRTQGNAGRRGAERASRTQATTPPVVCAGGVCGR